MQTRLLLIPIIVLAFYYETASAQAFKPGILAGLTTSQVGGDTYSGFNKLGVTFGGFVRYRIRENWSAQFEIYYVQKGSRNAFSISENNPDQASEYFMLRMNYAEVPLIVRFNHRKFVYELGLYYAQLIGFHMEYRDDFGGVSGPYYEVGELNSLLASTGNKEFSTGDIGVIIGLGYKISDNMLAGLRLSNSIIPVKEHDSGRVNLYPTQVSLGWTHTVISGTIRYTFGQGDE